ncbi:MAG: hypothetical protein EXR20_08075 [Bacteroidetes bacterium]|nr:hypothetical protein [Bacteroidota bacterium]
MKRKNSIFIVVIIFFSLILISCGGSVKGKWSQSDKEKFYKTMEGVKELSNFGANKTKWIDCYFSKCEANYSSFENANTDVNGVTKIGFECAEELK